MVVLNRLLPVFVHSLVCLSSKRLYFILFLNFPFWENSSLHLCFSLSFFCCPRVVLQMYTGQCSRAVLLLCVFSVITWLFSAVNMNVGLRLIHFLLCHRWITHRTALGHCCEVLLTRARVPEGVPEEVKACSCAWPSVRGPDHLCWLPIHRVFPFFSPAACSRRSRSARGWPLTRGCPEPATWWHWAGPWGYGQPLSTGTDWGWDWLSHESHIPCSSSHSSTLDVFPGCGYRGRPSRLILFPRACVVGCAMVRSPPGRGVALPFVLHN